MPHFDNCLNILFHANYVDDMDCIKGIEKEKSGEKFKKTFFPTI